MDNSWALSGAQSLLKCYSRLKHRNLQIQSVLMLGNCHWSFPDSSTIQMKFVKIFCIHIKLLE